MLTDIKKVRHIYDKIESAVRNLKSLKVDIWLYGPVFIFIIMNKLPTEIKLQISRIMPATEMWNVTNLLEVLLQEINSRELCSYMSHANLKQTNMGTTTGNPIIQRLQFAAAIHVILVLPALHLQHVHCVKSFQIWSYFWSVFSRIRTEYGPEITPYLDTFHAVLHFVSKTTQA